MIEWLSPLEIGMDALVQMMVVCLLVGIAKALLLPISRRKSIQFTSFRSFENANARK